MNKKMMLLSACFAAGTSMAIAQSHVTGRVVDADGNPVIGANVKVAGTKLIAVTDADGRFALPSVPSSAQKLNISYIGMATETVSIAGNVNVTMKVADNSLGEAVVTAYGQQKKIALTGAVSQLDAEKLDQRVVGNVTNALTGELPGVQAMGNSGQPGANATIRIRGIGSLSSSANPLIVVDGMPYDGDMNSINPSDIASISIQKDASACAIYGARGANGVVLITTKSGKTEDALVTVDAKWGSNSREIPQYDIIKNPGQYMEQVYKSLYNAKFYNGSTSAEAYAFADANLYNADNGGVGYRIYTLPEGENLIGRNFRLNPNAKLGYSDGKYYYTPDDWYDEAFNNSFRQEYNVNVSGKSDKLNYFASVGYLDDSGIIKNSRFQRYSGRARVDYQAKKWLKVGTNMAFTHSDTQSSSVTATADDSNDATSSGNLFFVTNMMAPIYPLYVRNADGTIKTDPNTGVVYDDNNTNFKRPGTVGNAVRDNITDHTKNYSDVLIGKWYATITPVDGLSLTATLSTNLTNQRLNTLNSRFGSALSYDGIGSTEQYRTFGVNAQYLAEYKKTFNAVHNIDLLAGYEQYKLKDQTFIGSNDHLFDPYVGELSNALGTDKKSVTSYTYNYMTEGFLARAQYDYNNKYFISASYRRDASSAFAKGHRWGNFGSVGGAWVISSETFMEGTQSWLNSLKLRSSWGVQGNDNLASSGRNFYAYADLYSVAYNNDTKQYSVELSRKGNKNITWETNYSFNVGLDFSVLDNRLSGTVEFFNRLTTDMLYNQRQPLSAGYETLPVNSGSMYNRGFELNLTGVLVRTDQVQWDVNLNLTHYKNKITDLDASIKADGRKFSYFIWKIGKSAYEAYLPKYAGVDKATGKPLYYVNPDKGDYTTTDDYSKAEQADLGSTLAKVFGGFGTSLHAYGIDFGFQFSYQLGGKIYDGGYETLMSHSAGQNWHKDLLKAWTPENPNASQPRLANSDITYQQASSRFLTSSNFLSINNITLGYTLPKTWLKAMQMSTLRIYVAGENLAVITARKGLDPRYGFGIGSSVYGSGNSTSSYSSLRTITGGITLTF